MARGRAGSRQLRPGSGGRSGIERPRGEAEAGGPRRGAVGGWSALGCAHFGGSSPGSTEGLRRSAFQSAVPGPRTTGFSSPPQIRKLKLRKFKLLAQCKKLVRGSKELSRSLFLIKLVLLVLLIPFYLA